MKDRFVLALALGVGILSFLSAPAEAVAGPGLGPILQTANGGTILGFDIDQHGNDGAIAESSTLGVSDYLTAVETFDERTAKVSKIVAQEQGVNDFVFYGIFGNDVGLVLHQVARGGRFSQEYLLMNPVSGNKFTGRWTPPKRNSVSMFSWGASQPSPQGAFMEFINGSDAVAYAFGSNVPANSFGRSFQLPSSFYLSSGPVMAMDPSHDRGVALTSPDAFGAPTVALVNLRNGAIDQFTGVGTGTVAGVAVDPNTGVACTTTSIDYSLEFYNLAKHTGFSEPVPGIGGQTNAPAAVAVDALNGLFVVTQPRLSTQSHTSSVLVYDEKGVLVEEIDGFDYMPVNPGLAINPRQRIGYVTLVNPNEFPLVNLLQKFSY